MMQFEQLGTFISKRDDPKFAVYQARISFDPHLKTDLTWLVDQGAMLDLPERVMETAILYMRKVRVKGYSCKRDLLRKGALFLACRMHGVERRVEHIADLDERPFPIVMMAYKIADVLGVDIKGADAKMLIFKAVETLGLPRRFYHAVMALLPKIEREYPSGHPKATNAGAILYILTKQAGQPRYQREIAAAFGVKERTVRMRARELKKALGQKEETLR